MPLRVRDCAALLLACAGAACAVCALDRRSSAYVPSPRALQLTFPTESSFKENAELARDVYTKVMLCQWTTHLLLRPCKVMDPSPF